jgi:hypothetical protein
MPRIPLRRSSNACTAVSTTSSAIMQTTLAAASPGELKLKAAL